MTGSNSMHNNMRDWLTSFLHKSSSMFRCTGKEQNCSWEIKHILTFWTNEILFYSTFYWIIRLDFPRNKVRIDVLWWCSYFHVWNSIFNRKDKMKFKTIKWTFKMDSSGIQKICIYWINYVLGIGSGRN